MDPEVTRIVRNRSSRGGASISLIVLHTTEGHNVSGLNDLKGLGSWFDNPSAQASSHVGNDAEGHDARYVPDHDKAWTQASYNRVALSIEQIGFASTNRKEWFSKARHQLANTAKWIAYWSKTHHVPIRRAWTRNGYVIRSGIATHKQLGVAGGGHHDPGTAYPMQYVLWFARYFKEKEAGRNGFRFKRARNKTNKIRKHYGLKPL